MKKLLNISLTLVLAITLIVMTSGVTFRHCSCSGKTTMLLGHLSDEDAQPSYLMGKGNHGKLPKSKGCMTFYSLSLSPTTTINPMAFDFHAFLPLISIINNWHTLKLLPQIVESKSNFLPIDFFSPPPRQYLHILRVLTI